MGFRTSKTSPWGPLKCSWVSVSWGSLGSRVNLWGEQSCSHFHLSSAQGVHPQDWGQRQLLWATQQPKGQEPWLQPL